MKIVDRQLVKDGGFFDMTEWEITISHNNRAITVKYFTGPGIRKWLKKLKGKPFNYSGYWSQYIKNNVGKQVGYLPPLQNPKNIKNKRISDYQSKILEEFKNITEPIAPEINNVMCALSLDASCVIHGESFEDFCSEFGYDCDRISAKKTFDCCRDSYFKLKQLGFSDKEIIEYSYSFES